VTRFRPSSVILIGGLLTSIGLSAEMRSGPVQSAAALRKPPYELGAGPVIAFDEVHKLEAAKSGVLVDSEFIKALRSDGYRPRLLTQQISAASLADVNTLIAIDPRIAFSDDEVSALVTWLKVGGSFLLTLDHFASVQSKLTASLGVRNWPGNPAWIRTDLCKPAPPGCGGPDQRGNRSALYIFFWRTDFFPGGEPSLADGGGPAKSLAYQSSDAILARHATTEGRGEYERIRRLVSRSGSAFQSLPGSVPLLTLPRGAVLGGVTTTPDAALGEKELAGRPIAGWLQGAVVELGKGRVAVFADDTLVTGGTPNNDNRQFALNLMLWLSRVL
jgi:hypothetical protein